MATWSGLWNNEYGENYSLLSNRVGNNHLALARVFAQRIYARGALGAVLKSLVDGAVGDPATMSHKRITAERNLEANVQGGKRVIETFLDINRVTTTTDRDKLSAAIALSPKPSTYPKDKSGNGGGGKLGY